MKRTKQNLSGSLPVQRSASLSRIATPRLFRLDGGYVVLTADALARGPRNFEALGSAWSGYHVIGIARAPQDATEADLAALGRAAQAFDRIVICQSRDPAMPGSAEAAARFARAVRGAGRAECHVAADAHRALRHCIDGMVPGDVIAYCCEDAENAARILAEYGATPVREGASKRPGPANSARVALKCTTGELTAAHA
jgi:hypothetical protein